MKQKIAVLGSSWAYNFITSILCGIKNAYIKAGIEADIYFYTCYKFHNADMSPNITGYGIFELINYEDYDGIILLTNLFEEDSILQTVLAKIKKAKVPAVSLIQKIPGLPFVSIDNYNSFHNLVLHLIEKHNIKKFAYINGIQGDAQTIQRFTAFKDALSKHNLTIKKEDIYESDWSFKAGYLAGKKILDKNKDLPEAVVCSNDYTACGLLKAAYERGIRIPEQMKIVGFDNELIAANSYPSLSTVNLDNTHLGTEAANILINKKKKAEITIHSDYLIRQSCGCTGLLSYEQKTASVNSMYVQDEEERFTAHLRHIENIFINDENINMFWNTFQEFFTTRHYYEGENFSIVLKKEFVDSVIHNQGDYTDKPFEDELQSFVTLNKGKTIKPQIIKTKNLMPDSLKLGKFNIFIFIPLICKDFFFGYYVGKNNLSMLKNKRGYSWAKNVANSLEKFKEKTKYRHLSDMYLKLSTQDALSGTLNRTALDLYAKKLFEENKKNKLYTIIYFLDINNMKLINDAHGHMHGDLAVKIVGHEIIKEIPKDWYAIRYGGDEFLIVGTCESKKYEDYLKNINTELKKHTVKMTLPYELSVSIGQGCSSPHSILSFQEEINKVDTIMYKNKKMYHKKNDPK